MTIHEVVYCTRPMVQRALNIADTPRLNGRVDAAIQAGARDLEGFLHRRFYPETETVTFDLPESDTLWLYQNELAGEPTEILSGGEAMNVDVDYLLRPNSGPPFGWIEARYGGDTYWQTQGTEQGAISITGDFGYPTDPVVLTELADAADADDTTIVVADSSQAAPGALLLAGNERMIVSDAALVDTGVTLTADLGNQKSNTILTVSDGSLVFPGELIFIEGERLDVQSVAGNTVVCERAVNASALAAHTTGASVYAPRALTVLRGRLGTEAADYTDGAPLSWLKPPSLITELNLALAINNTEQALSAYSRPVGSQDNQRDQVGRGVDALFEDAYTRYGRKTRGRAV